MSWCLYLDDQIHDPAAPTRRPPLGFLGASSTEEAIELVKKLGPPIFMSLDHDLSESDRSIDFLKWLAENHYEHPPKFAVHSANPIGKENINSFMKSWILSVDK